MAGRQAGDSAPHAAVSVREGGQDRGACNGVSRVVHLDGVVAVRIVDVDGATDAAQSVAAAEFHGVVSATALDVQDRVEVGCEDVDVVVAAARVEIGREAVSVSCTL